MNPYFNLARRTAVYLSAAVMLGACSFAGTLYQTAPKLALYELNSTLDLSAAQYDLGVQRLEGVYEWHRKKELPELIAQLKAASRLAPSGATPAHIAATVDAALLAARRMAAQTLPLQVELAQSLTPANLQALQKKQAKDNAKFVKEWGIGQTDGLTIAQDKRFETFLTWAERIYGDLSAEQTRSLRAASDARALRLDWMMDERRVRQQALLTLLRGAVDKKLSPAQLTAAISEYTANLERASTPERQAYFELSRVQMQALIAQLTQLTTPAQRAVAQKKLQDFAQDFQAIYDKP